MNIMTPQWGEVVMHPTEDDGTFGVSGLPPGDYELLVFEPGGSTDIPIASKKVTLAAGQKERIEIRLGSDNPGRRGEPGSRDDARCDRGQLDDRPDRRLGARGRARRLLRDAISKAYGRVRFSGASGCKDR